MPDFISVLVVAVLSLIILLIAFGGSTLFAPYKNGSRSSSRTVDIGKNFVVMYVQGQSNITHLGGQSSQGVFDSMSQKTSFPLSNYMDATEGTIKLKVWNSNYYGNLFVYINGQQVYRGAPQTGDNFIGFDGGVFKANNTIEVDAENSGWKIWAPTVYIFDADISASFIGKQTHTFSFDMSSSEAANVNRARLLVFGSRSKGTGPMDVMLNGVEIFSGLTPIYTDFAIDGLKAGNNTLELSTEQNTIYNITSAQIVLFF